MCQCLCTNPAYTANYCRLCIQFPLPASTSQPQWSSARVSRLMLRTGKCSSARWAAAVSAPSGGSWGTTELFCITLNHCLAGKQTTSKWTSSSSARDPRLHFDFISLLRKLLRLGQQRKEGKDFSWQVERPGKTEECVKIVHLL